ncbi:MAG TPA: ABC transporter permease, partial [Candidatus Acidoferrum sp.]|nr:ABC transporter permease [Candidatus Acidoferrum sp.]
MLDGWFRDMVHGFRSLRKNPILSLTAVLTLTLGIGANTAIFTLLYGLVLRSLPIPDAYHLVKVGVASAAEPDSEQNTSFMPYRMLQGLRERQSSFRDLSAWDGDQVLLKDIEGAVRGYFAVTVSGNAFDLLGVQPYRGRLIATYDDVRGGPQGGWPVVLSYGFWNEFFSRDPNIVGKQIKISDVPVTIVGITPPDFHGVWPGNEPKMYMPMQIETVLAKRQDLLEGSDSEFGVSVIGRLKPGVTLQQANTELALLQKDLFTRFIPAKYQHIPYVEKAYLTAGSARSGLPTYVSRTYSKPLYLMQGLVGVVLLLCCVNIGGLMMARIAARQREFAVRTAVGASSWRLLRQYLTEGFIIAIAGSSIGAIAAWYGSGFLLHFFRDPMMFESMSIHPDKAIFWMTVLFAVLTTLLFGTLPAWRAARTDPGLLLKSRTGMGGRRQIAGRLFVPIQVAMSLALVVLASLLSQSVIRLRTENTGFDLDHVTIQTSPMYLLEKKGEAKLDLYQRMVDRLMELPAVDAAAATSQTPMTGEKITADFVAVTEGPNPPEDTQMPYNDVGPGYFRTMKTRIIAGREFEKDERELNVCILNQSAAAFFFPNQQPLGRYVRSRNTQEFPDQIACRVIGLAEDAKFFELRQGPPRTIYLPLSTKRIDNLGNLVFLIHTPRKPQAIAAFRKAISEIAPTVPLVIFVTLREQMDAALGSQELITLLANFFG